MEFLSYSVLQIRGGGGRQFTPLVGGRLGAEARQVQNICRTGPNRLKAGSGAVWKLIGVRLPAGRVRGQGDGPGEMLGPGPGPQRRVVAAGMGHCLRWLLPWKCFHSVIFSRLHFSGLLTDLTTRNVFCFSKLVLDHPSNIC